MIYSDFLDSILSQKLTLNEISLLVELGFSDFSREELLNGENRVPKNTYSPSALTRTTQKLIEKSMVVKEEDSGKTKFRLIDRCSTYGHFENILLEIARSKYFSDSSRSPIDFKSRAKLLEASTNVGRRSRTLR